MIYATSSSSSQSTNNHGSLWPVGCGPPRLLFLIDEISQVGGLTLAAVDSRLRQYRDDQHRPFGGIPMVLFFGDFFQFDPVLQTALANLSPEFRAAVVLSDIEDLSYEEVGRILGVKMGTVRSRIHRGRAALRAELEAAGVTGAHQRID